MVDVRSYIKKREYYGRVIKKREYYGGCVEL